MIDESTRNVVAGFLSTIDFNPSLKHPEEMLPWADEVILVVLGAKNVIGYDRPSGIIQTGQRYMDTTTNHLYRYNGRKWKRLFIRGWFRRG